MINFKIEIHTVNMRKVYTGDEKREPLPDGLFIPNNRDLELLLELADIDIPDGYYLIGDNLSNDGFSTGMLPIVSDINNNYNHVAKVKDKTIVHHSRVAMDADVDVIGYKYVPNEDTDTTEDSTEPTYDTKDINGYGL